MSSSKLFLSGVLLAGVLVGCEPPPVEPELTISVSPRTVDGIAQKATVKVTGVDDKAKPGTGKVRVTSAAGSLKDSVEVDLVAGEGTTDFLCARATDPACMSTVRLTAEWVVSGKLVTANTSVTIAPAPPVDAGTASISVTATPNRFEVGSGAASTIVATYIADTVPGAGAAVTLTTSAGTLRAIDGGTFSALTTDSAGQVSALLVDNGSPAVATVTATGPRSTSSTATVTFDARDAGPPVDGGYSISLAADKGQIIAGVGDATILTATLASVRNTAALPVTFSTSVGRLGPVGGSGVATNYVANTDDAGIARAQLVAGSTDMGQAMVNASLDGGATSNTVTVNIVNVSQISFVSTECPQTTMNCNLMGLQGSGFNETALVKFKVADGTGAGVSGVVVNFSLNGAPAGTSVDPTGQTNAMGEVRANVRAGRTIGTFTVTATALSMFSVTSPTIGVRGAKASNRGFSLRCDRVNLAAYAAVTPPLPLTVNCQVGLTDRYGNPIGTGTQVRLNSEAGVVPNNVATNPFSPSGTAEGFGAFIFNTQTATMPVDVTPLLPNPTQFPIPLVAEPSIAGPIVRNPRDGLVTIIAYLQGEEDFKDDNGNGAWDTTEQFIDQGEPFVDSNDNNQWDTGETFVDTPPPDGGVANGMWDGPNGSWDSNAQIWTEYRLIYTGPAGTPASLSLSTRAAGGSYGTISVGTSRSMFLYAADQNLNRPEGGTTLAARFSPATRGSITISGSNAGLDGYGFDLQRVLLNPAGTGSCTPTELVCRWKMVFGDWSQGLVADVVLTAGTAPATPTAQAAIVDVTVRGVTTPVAATGVVE